MATRQLAHQAALLFSSLRRTPFSSVNSISGLLVQQNRLLARAADAGHPVAAAVLRVQALESLWQWQRVRSAPLRLAEYWARLEQRAAALGNALICTQGGQKLLATVLPLTVAAVLFPQRSHALSVTTAKDLRQLREVLPRQQSQPLLMRLFSSVKVPPVVLSVMEELALWARGAYLAALFTPSIVTGALAFWWGGSLRAWWMGLIVWTLERAGPAFIKWGQWASTRPDLFPPDLCHSLERLQTAAPAHGSAYSRAAVAASFNRPVTNLFDAFEDVPVASGSIAQIHRARLSATGSHLTGGKVKPGTVVAVKVRHPGVTLMMQRDFELMERAARVASSLPGLADLRLDESLRQFGGPLKEQLDLQVEAEHLTRFKKNFRLWSNVSFPTPIYPLVASDVLVESFEDGDHVSTLINQPGYKHRLALAETGLSCYLQMLLRDNFIHADLHPGNILVREVDLTKIGGVGGWLSYLLAAKLPPKLILLDTGMIAELSDRDQVGLIQFFKALTQQDGEMIGKAILGMSETHTCKNPDAFVGAMRHMFDVLDPEYIHRHTSQVIESIIDTIRQHQVTLRSTVSTVVVTTLVLEGWSSKLNPDMRILDHMRDILLVDWGDRISRTVDKIMKSGALAVA